MAKRPVKPRGKRSSSEASAAERRKLFVEALLSNGRNATQAALAAGFSPKSAHSQGGRLLRHVEVVALLQQRSAELAQKYELTTENVIKSLAQAVHFDPRRLYRPDGTMKHPTEWDEDTAAAMSGFEVTEEFAGTGKDRLHIGYTKKVKWLDKNTAREQAMKHLGLFEQDNKQRALEQAPVYALSTEALLAIAAKGGK